METDISQKNAFAIVAYAMQKEETIAFIFAYEIDRNEVNISCLLVDERGIATKLLKNCETAAFEKNTKHFH